MTKAILQYIPHYMLSLLPAPKGVVKKIRNTQRTFLWSGKADKQKWALVAWEKLRKPRILGGLGLQHPATVNKACGAKLWWRWVKDPQTPWAKLWKAKYVDNLHHQDLIRMTDSLARSPI